ncbi:glycoside hydrolase family 16 protein [Ephemerocybe angulata]|uniref:Glycoside hydrolase family 16 protein n=1 Tax=Ephemerocybe angulata TaxID=980116 RepID=A0A8H6IGU6_9AGAR|nr:glycoside hydrolase family 16 protein [Tulosesus angulatus]
MWSTLSIGLPFLVAILAGESVKATACNVTTPCPFSAPCCSEFGFCGKGHFCLGGCNPFASRSIDSCKPEPVCKDAEYVFTDNSRILSNSTFFEGNATQYDWVLENGNIFNTNKTGGELAMTLTEKNGGTKLSSTRYVHYGTITAKLKTGRWKGVVTAFITMSDIKDEIDWEFPGAATTEGQSNLFWQGYIPTDKTNGATHTGLSDTYSNYHDFTIDWQPDSLSWSIDGKVVRTVKKSDFVEGGLTRYPNTPSRVQLSIWPAGIESSGKGTVEWAGGMIDWTDPDYKSAGQFSALVKSVSVKCANLPSLISSANATNATDITSYVYASNGTGGVPVVAYTNRSTNLNGVGRGMAMLGVEGGKWQLAVLGFTGLLVAGSQVILGL